MVSPDAGTVVLLACGAACVLAPAHVLVPFLQQRQRTALSSASHACLLPGTRCALPCSSPLYLAKCKILRNNPQYEPYGCHMHVLPVQGLGGMC